jgi:hypothetical protein
MSSEVETSLDISGNLTKQSPAPIRAESLTTDYTDNTNKQTLWLIRLIRVIRGSTEIVSDSSPSAQLLNPSTLNFF